MTVAYAEAVRVALRTSTGTQDFTIAGFGTPVAARITLLNATADGTVASGMRFSQGFYDGTRMRMVAEVSTDNVGTAACYRSAAQAHVAGLIKFDGSGWDVLVQGSSLITDGVRLNVSATDGVAYLILVELFGGADAQAYTGHFEMGSVSAGATLAVTDPPFSPDFIFFDGANTPFASGTPTPVADNMVSIAFGASNLEQARCTVAFDNGLTTTECGLQVPAALTNNIYLRVTPGAGTTSTGEGVRLTNILSPGFEVTSPTTATIPQIGYLAIRFGGVSADLAIITSPTTAGQTASLSMTNPGYAFLIEMAIASLSGQAGTVAGMIGCGFASRNSTFCWGTHESDNVTTTNNGIVTEDKTLRVLKQDGASDHLVADGSFSTTAFTLTYSTVETNGRFAYLLLIPSAIFSATGAGSFGHLTGSGASQLVFSASGAGSFAHLTGSGVASQVFSASGAGSFGHLTGSGTAQLVFSASGAGSFRALTGSGTALTAFVAVGVGTFGALSGSGAAQLVFIVAGAGSLGALSGSAIAELVFVAAGAGAFAHLTGSGTAELQLVAAGAGAFAPLAGSGQAELVFVVIGVGTFGSLSGSGTAVMIATIIGAGAGVFAALRGAGTVELVFVLTGAGSFAHLVGAGSDSFFLGCPTELDGSAKRRTALLASAHRSTALAGGYHRVTELNGSTC